MARLNKNQRQIFQLLESGNPDNVRLGLVLAEAQQLDLSNWWADVHELWHYANHLTPGQLPPPPAQQLDEVMGIRSLYWWGKTWKTLPKALPLLCSLESLALGENIQLDWKKTIAALERLPQLKSLRWINRFTAEIDWQQRHTYRQYDLTLTHPQIPAARLRWLFAALPRLFPALSVLRIYSHYTGQALPQDIALPPTLEHLIIKTTNGRIAIAPDAIGSLPQLQTLEIRQSKLALLPDSIGNLQRLRSIDLSGNHLLSLPDTIGACTNLQRLLLSGNFIVQLPLSFARLQQLRILDVRHNPLDWAQVIPLLQPLPNLSEIYLRITDISPNMLDKLRCAAPHAKIIY